MGTLIDHLQARDILRDAMRILDIRLTPPLATQQYLDMQSQVAALFSEEGFRAAPSLGPPSRSC